MRRVTALTGRTTIVLFLAAALLEFACPNDSVAAVVTLKDGRVLKGKIAPTNSVSAPPNPNNDVDLILIIDDGLTRTFVPQRMVQEVKEVDLSDTPVRITIDQVIPSGGLQINSAGPIINLDPFNEHGRRTLSMNTTMGPIDVIQGITQITPVWTKVEAMRQFKWDMRIATSSIPRETLSRIIATEMKKRRVGPDNLERRKDVVRLFVQSERYQDARKELDQIVLDFPDQQAQLAPLELLLQQLSARRTLSEIKLRRANGQHQMAHNFLTNFPTMNVAGDILQEVRELLESYADQKSRYDQLQSKLVADFEALDDTNLKRRIEPVLEEIKRELNVHTLDRLTAYEQLAGDAGLKPADKLALAISGWLLGRDSALEKLEVAISLYQVRELIHRYFNEPLKLNREQILADDLKRQEGATPAYIAKLLLHMKPPLDTPPAAEATPGFHELTIPGPGASSPISYLVQLPPEYDPYRRYPAIVTLRGAGSSTQQQLDWWTGSMRGPDGSLLGQASRFGYIVIAPNWAGDHQKEYRYSAIEHAAVLNSLRDASKRFSIDTDRVFLSGHSMGGDAAWDIGLAHPDLWAGVIPIVAVSDKYCMQYWPNAMNLPQYIVSGDLDGDKTVRNARELDRYLTRIGFNATAVEYLGRGHEHFSDEILKIFDWMGRYRRNFHPREFSTRSMREWDNYFWFVELSDFPEKSLVDPAAWPPPRSTLPITTEGTVQGNNVRVKTGAGQVSVWLSPELVNFEQPVRVFVNGDTINGRFVEPDLRVLLEDVRTRGDRQHPFWTKVETPGSRGKVAGGK